jgi:hypothetical protein
MTNYDDEEPDTDQDEPVLTDWYDEYGVRRGDFY